MKNLLPTLVLGALLSSPDEAVATAFDSQIQRCPQSCSTTGTQMSDWTSYHFFDRLDLCLSPVLFGFNVYNDLNKYQTIKACTVDNGSKNGTAPSPCSSMSSVSESLELAWDSTSSDSASSTVISQVLLALQSQVENDASCGNGPTILLAHYQDLVAALYVGAAFDSVTAVQNLASQISQNQESIAGVSASAQICGSDRDTSQTLGLMLSTTSDYQILQSAVQNWNNATCVKEFTNTNVLSNITFFQLPKQNVTGSTVQKRADTCSYTTVVSGDGCASLATRCGITAAELSTYNPSPTLCSTLAVGEIIYCSAGSVPDLSPQPSSDGCGPQVSGTTRPSNWSDISSLNPCPLNACCDIWGQYGITPEFCTITQSSTGAPGTAVANTNRCISNCGTEIVNNSTSAGELFSIGYYEAFGVSRPCLVMNADQLPSSYSHIHFAFGEIASDYTVDISSIEDQFKTFANQTNFKKILSFGGWSFSTSLDSYPIFRDTVSDTNRLAFAQNLVSFVAENNLDGVDFDWEYPDAPDIPGIPPGSPTDGPNYLSFLKTLRSLLPSEKTISIAAPASYWYLKGFPIANISDVVDYIVYMTYNLHGQWDWNKTFVNPGCTNGNCLRSHVNLTETEYALSMITKAGVPASKVVVGIASYGRSFGMEDPSCTGPECLFTGPNSTATEGDCTGTAGYISQAELSQLKTPGLALRSTVTTWHDDESDSDMMTYGDNTWVSYMEDSTKTSRINLYAALGFLGTVEWALDLTNFVLTSDEADAAFNITAAEEDFTAALSLSGYNISNFETYNLTLLASKLVGHNGCDKQQQRTIYSGWQQSWEIMNYIMPVAYDGNGIDFNEAAAVEYLGPPAMNKHLQERFKNIFIQLPWDWRIVTRCDDPRGACSCGDESTTVAYTLNSDPDEPSAPSINFCPEYFDRQTLSEVMKNTNPNYPPSFSANMDNYNRNQASTWIHELLHIDWVALANGWGPNAHVTDLKMAYINGPNTEIYTAYGPQLTKGLARAQGEFVDWTIRNADSMSLFALAKYVQNKLGNVYPHLPLAPPPPTKVALTIPGYFTVYSNGTGDILNQTAVDEISWSASMGVCAAGSDQDSGASNAAIATVTSGWPVETDFPSDYLSSWSSWAGLTPTTTSTAPTPTASWIISIYSENGCTGDYYVVEGYNYGTSNVQCLDFQSLPLTAETGATCGWYTNGGASFTGCSNSNLTQPLSWRLKSGGTCTVFADPGCSMSDNWQGYSPSDGCHDYTASDFDVQNWAALECSVDPPGNSPLQQLHSSPLTSTMTSSRSTVPRSLSTSMRVTATSSY
ncbi:conserved hypothetical protein [Talaromyces marneffei ATCC 18224]|uniref:chitinase n=1 Tax=Talaromyces marneffei (strain ATCC 18224 / CBS 334.59 / QM 7333) TaxID=441960 RepID=B6Q995_TALMQ|nr:conserved hypothetical protein [Talaromyces marneffei ATCC 18224]